MKLLFIIILAYGHLLENITIDKTNYAHSFLIHFIFVLTAFHFISFYFLCLAQCNRQAFESGPVSNVGRSNSTEEEENLPAMGAASEARKRFEQGDVIHAEDRWMVCACSTLVDMT